MAVVIRARDVPARRRVDAWCAVVHDVLGPLEVRIDPDAPLRGAIEAAPLGLVNVGRIRTSTPHSVHRTPQLIRKEGPELYRVVLALEGSLALSQDERTVRLDRGEFAIYDFSRPYDLAYDAAVRLAVFGFPRSMLSLPLDSVAEITAVPFAADGGAAALVAPLLRRVALDLDGYEPASAARLSSVVLNLLTAAVAERIDEPPPEESRQRTLLMRVHAFIDQHLGELDLAPGTIAAAHHISVRQLHRLFQAQNSSVAAWIRRRRLERCREDLANAVFHTTPVSVIATRWGLPDSAHFSRLFRDTYGMPPAEYRRASLMPSA